MVGRVGVRNGWESSALLLVACSLSAADDARASAAPGSAASDVEATDRSRVVIGFLRRIDPAQRAALVNLLGPELGGHEPQRELSVVGAEAPNWLDRVQSDRRALLIVLVDAPASRPWKLYLVDAARRRAILREIPGEDMGNLAALETVASVVSSAVRALDEGLEIASQPLASVLTDSAPPAAEGQLLAAAETRRLRLRGGLGAAAASFEDSIPATTALSASLRLAWPFGMTLGAGVAPHWPAEFESSFGNFEVQRTHATVSAGFETRPSPWQLAIETGVIFELLRRRAVDAEGGAAAREDGTLLRVGPSLTLSSRHRIAPKLALLFAVGGAYFPQRTRYTLVSSPDRELASPWPLMGLVQVGLELTVFE